MRGERATSTPFIEARGCSPCAGDGPYRSKASDLDLAAARPKSARPPLRIVALTPGVGGMGGISRLMDDVSQELHRSNIADVAVRFVSTRGDIKPLRPLIYVSSVIRVLLACASGRCDLLHVNLASFGSTYRKLLLAGMAAATGTPYILHLHGGEYREFWTTRSRPMKRLIEALFRRAQRIVVLGSVWRDFVAHQVPDAAERITILPNATRAPAKPPAKRADKAAVTILFIGRLNASKGVPELVEALATLKDMTGWSAVLAGDGEVSQTRAAIRALGLADRVQVPGWLNADQIRDLWLRGDIFVLPSMIENLPLSIVEAFAHGVPVICTPVGSVPEIVEDGRTGLIVPAGDSKALARALERLIQDQGLRNSLASGGLEAFAARFELGGYVRRLAALWKAAAAGPSDKLR
jgi:glycosyltransferase involved in cell wall biosynthesis